MRTVQTETRFPLASVKPLEELLGYRAYCMERTEAAGKAGTFRRKFCPVTGEPLVPLGQVGPFEYLRSPANESFFLAELALPQAWARLLAEVSLFRHSPAAFQSDLSISRFDHVYKPRVEWIQETLALHGIRRARLLEVLTPPSDLAGLLKQSSALAEVRSVDEMTLAHSPPQEALGEPFTPYHGSPALECGPRSNKLERGGEEGESQKGDSPKATRALARGTGFTADAVLLQESLDRVDEPAQLLTHVRDILAERGLLFVTALVSSGFDIAVLGVHNKYLYPPDRANCFSLEGLKKLLEKSGFALVEVSTPGVLDLEIVQAHLLADPAVELSRFERRILSEGEATRSAFQAFLQEQALSSFARLVAKKKGR